MRTNVAIEQNLHNELKNLKVMGNAMTTRIKTELAIRQFIDKTKAEEKQRKENAK